MHCPNCRAALPPGSRFCNGCGTAVAAPPPAGPARTTAIPPQAYAQPVPPGQPRVAAGYQPPPQGYQPPPQGYAQMAPPPAVERKKPVLLLSAILLLLVGAVVAACVMVAGGFKGHSAVAGDTVRGNKSAPGVAFSQTPGSPTAPNIGTANRPGMPVGPNAVQAKGNSDNPVPNMILSQNGHGPGAAPSAVLAPTPGMPTAPSAVIAPGVRSPNSPNATLGKGGPAIKGPNAVQGPGPQAPPDNRDFDAYLRWLHFVESERHGLRAMGETASFRVIEKFYNAMLGMADPDSDPTQFDRDLRVMLNQTVGAMRKFQSEVIRSRRGLLVPPDCQALDRYYMAAMSDEGAQSVLLLEALSRKDVGTIKRIGKTGVSNIDRNLGMANKELEKVYRGRGLNQQFTIETGGNSSMLGGVIGMGGL